ncbi:hypothetical protein ABXT08_11265 [Chryseobacterium sp. NRRL B-14859]|uniref:hypothetical protein n=1 Tax=unclassified Chryseobacterium TaxID=2593645 RepID=UPI000F45715C|nr:hypothetical protein [Chryseobacterium sp. G0240]ROI05908.1 hypothetical protein EGI16_05880 [Chryseobacterium sp. G0240]
MIFENDTLQNSSLNDKNNALENETLFPVIINSYGVTAFLIKSLEKIKKNAQCEILKTVIDKYMEEYILHLQDFHVKNTTDTSHENTEIRIETPSFTLYAKMAYYKVLKEEEYIHRLLHILENGKRD